MFTTICLAALTLLAAGPLYEGVPDDVPTFKVSGLNEGEMFAGIIVDGDWLRDYSTEIPRTKTLEIVPDEPWRPYRSFKSIRARVELEYEVEFARQRRLAQGWEQAGYVFIERGDGAFPVQQAELEYAERAREMEQALLDERAEAAASVAQTGNGEEEPDGPGYEQWIGHVVALLIGITLAGVVLKTMVFD